MVDLPQPTRTSPAIPRWLAILPFEGVVGAAAFYVIVTNLGYLSKIFVMILAALVLAPAMIVQAGLAQMGLIHDVDASWRVIGALYYTVPTAGLLLFAWRRGRFGTWRNCLNLAFLWLGACIAITVAGAHLQPN